MFQLISPEEDLFAVLYWVGEPVLTVRGHITGDTVPHLTQQTTCHEEDKEMVIFFLERIADCLRVGSHDPDNPTVLLNKDDDLKELPF